MSMDTDLVSSSSLSLFLFLVHDCHVTTSKIKVVCKFTILGYGM
ncbi:hypothetical protein SLEP1_g39493 [Rubroshorea leprosula]|uniref:Uncharacterized protein n=1 Tax=Rubroshorea leprosula TaxID=152421 RepID=A0AAV5L0S6_9ROSI|nr:hypothetical protein SLEP1_g39493 [Rubroshorea leprosula]